MCSSKKIYTLEEIKEISQPVFEKYPTIKEAYLFGSYARGEATEHSDLDFLIKLIDSKFKTYKETFVVDVDLEDAFQKQVDVLTDRELEQLRSVNIERDKVLIYER